MLRTDEDMFTICSSVITKWQAGPGNNGFLISHLKILFLHVPHHVLSILDLSNRCALAIDGATMGPVGNERSCYLGRALGAGVSGSMETPRRLIKCDSAQPLIFRGGPGRRSMRHSDRRNHSRA